MKAREQVKKFFSKESLRKRKHNESSDQLFPPFCLFESLGRSRAVRDPLLHFVSGGRLICWPSFMWGQSILWEPYRVFEAQNCYHWGRVGAWEQNGKGCYHHPPWQHFM